MELFPKKAICSALACLMKEPSLQESNKIKLEQSDFEVVGESNFYKIIFASITNLYADGVQKITPTDIDEYLSSYDSYYETFNQNNGIEFLQHIEELANVEAYPRYSNRIRKFTLLRSITNLGLPIDEIYKESDDTETNTVLQAEFEQLDVNDILKYYDSLINALKTQFSINDKTVSGIAGENGLELFKSFKESPQYGVSTGGVLRNSVFRGHLLGSSMLRSAGTNTYKTRTSLSEAIDLSISKWYDWEKREWVDRSRREKVLYITTEMPQNDLEPTLWAYVSGVKEEKIRDYDVTEEEEIIVKESIKHIAETKNFYFDYVPKFDPTSIHAIVKKYALNYDVDYVFFDYVHLNFDVMREVASQTKGMTQREDMILGVFAAGLAELAQEYKFHISTSTQVNGDIQYAKKLDQNVLRGAKNMADKFSKGVVMTRPTNEDLKDIEAIMSKGIHKHEPNMIWHIYKNRHSKFKGKLYLYVDYDTMRMYDLFMTDDNGQLMDVPERDLIIKEAEESEQETTEKLPF